MKRIAVVGGGLFGCTAAIYLSRLGHGVHLYETKPQLMAGATAGTYSRLHRGYHYPRSAETGLESRRAEKSFRAEYGAAVIDSGEQFYVVPETPANHVTVDGFRDFLDAQGLSFAEENGVFQVYEPRVHLGGLQALVRQKVKDAGVVVHLATRADHRLRDEFEHIIVAAYSGLNGVLIELGLSAQEYRYQVVERPIVVLPQRFADTSIVVIDGPFGCIDPLDDSPLHVLGHVTKTIHSQNTGVAPEIPDHLAGLIDQGILRVPPYTMAQEAISDLGQYIPGLWEAQHIGSSFVVRAVLAHVEATDQRPTLVDRVDEQVIKVFSGKLGTAVRAAHELVGMLDKPVVHRRELIEAIA